LNPNAAVKEQNKGTYEFKWGEEKKEQLAQGSYATTDPDPNRAAEGKRTKDFNWMTTIRWSPMKG
jgi:hypothetical protein